MFFTLTHNGRRHERLTVSLLEDSALNNCFSHTKFSFKSGYTYQISAEPDLVSHSLLVGGERKSVTVLSRVSCS